jgi:hypothetical protein
MRPIPPPVAMAITILLFSSYIVIYELVVKLIKKRNSQTHEQKKSHQ